MKLSDGLRQGDRVLVEAVVKFDPDKDEATVFLDLAGNNYSPVRVPIESIKSLVRRKWKIGEKVLTDDDDIWAIVAVHENSVWIVGPENDPPITVAANELRPYVAPIAPPSEPEKNDE